jgi:uncharacterized protein
MVLPTLGAVELAGAGDGWATLSTSEGEFTVGAVTVPPGVFEVPGVAEAPGVFEVPGWRAAWTLGAGGVRLEDQDPYRDCHEWTAAGVQTAADARWWSESLEALLALVAADVPGQLPTVHTGLKVLTPLVPDPNGAGRASTARHAFGAVAVAPAPVRDLAEMVVHELQHSKLGAVLDLVPLFDRADPRRISVGWRDDPRPIGGVLQGIYAFLAVADVWRARAEADPRSNAPAEYRRYRDWTRQAIDDLTAVDALTPAGARFVARLAATVDGWPA